MIHAFILVALTNKVEPSLIAKSISEINEVINAHMVSGKWGIVTEVKVEDMGELRQITLHKIQDIDGVSHTNTLIVAE
jgi:DNA-binding Lrp family transcriptional regulator